MTDIKTKSCSRCNQEKPLSAFYQKQPDDYAEECLDCRGAAASGQSLAAPSSLSQEQALLEVSMFNAEASGQSFDDVVVDGISGGLPPEVLTRMNDLWEKTQEIGGEVIEVGKIIVMKIIEFIRAHPKLGASLALGAAVYVLAHAIPFIGPLLAPLLAAGTTLYAYGKVSSLDESIKLANEFFQLLVDIFNAAASHWATA